MKKSVRKSLAGMLAACMVLGGGLCLSETFSVFEAGIVAEAATYGDVTYEINNDDTVTITGCSSDAIVVDIPETIEGKVVTAIAEKAFCDNKLVARITIADSVTTIGQNAFTRCSALRSVKLSQNITEISPGCFRESGIRNIAIPFGVRVIHKNAFFCCNSLTEVELPNSVQVIDQGAFYLHVPLKITVPPSVVSINGDALSNYNYNSDVTVVGYEDTEAQYYAAGNGNRFESLGIYCGDNVTADKVVNLKCVTGNAIQWTKASNVVQYNIYVNGKKSTKTTNAFYAFQNLTAGLSYTIGVTAVGADGTESAITTTTFTAKAMLAKPTGLKREGRTLRWDAVKGAAKYRVYVIDAETLEVVTMNTNVTAKSYTFKTLTSGNKYKLRVCAVSSAGVLGKSVTTATFTAK